MNIQHIHGVPPLYTNTFLIITNAKHGILIDAAAEPGVYLKARDEAGATLTHILLTHGHYDHTGAVVAIAEETGAPVWMNRRDTRKPGENDPYRFAPPEGCNFYDDGDCVDVDALHFQVIATPGHTPGGVSLVCGEALFTGAAFAEICKKAGWTSG